MSTFTYSPPEAHVFLHTLRKYLERTGKAWMSNLLANVACEFITFGRYSGQRWNAYSASLRLRVPMDRISQFSPTARTVILAGANTVMPSEVGYDLDEFEVAPVMEVPPSEDGGVPEYDAGGDAAAGPMAAALQWSALSDEQFERLIFCIISDANGYKNPAWLTKTRAPDRGRDLSVMRVHEDSLGTSITRHVIIQCKHWQSRSIPVEEVADAVAKMKLWEPPPVDVIVIATSGRFTSDAVVWIERHNHERQRPEIEPWPDSRMELLLARRPHLVAEFGLR